MEALDLLKADSSSFQFGLLRASAQALGDDGGQRVMWG